LSFSDGSRAPAVAGLVACAVAGLFACAVAAFLACALLAPSIARASAPTVTTNAAPPTLSVRAAALVEKSTGQVLYEENSDAELAIASTTKLMTALVTLEHVHDLNKIFTQNDYVAATGDSQIGLRPGEQMSVHDLLLAMLLPSADDAAEDLAYNVGGGSVSNFIAMMNTRAQQLGLHQTHYATPSGLDTPGNYSSAGDLVKLARYLLIHHPFFRHAVAVKKATLTTGYSVRHVVNLDDLLNQYSWINGVKTGHTDDAGYVLVSSGTQDGMTLIGAVLGTASEQARDSNSLALLSWGFSNYRLAHPIVAGALIARPTVNEQPGRHATVIAATGFSDVVPRDASVHIRLDLPHQLSGPKQRDAAVGSAVVLVNGRTVGRVKLVLAYAIPAVSPLTLAVRFITRPITLVLLVMLLILSVAVVLRMRARARQRTAV
jgi:serine-type D-Ala-D-Ala carboxypeptidase (penicillin-binding protein 5/6)